MGQTLGEILVELRNIRTLKLTSNIVIIGLGLASISCVALGGPDLQTPKATSDLLSQPDRPESTSVNNNPISSGSLAVQSADGNVYIVSQETEIITLEPSSGDGDTNSGLGHPTWSTDGWLSYVEARTTVPGFTLWGYDPATNRGAQIYESSSTSYIYGSWSPAQCKSVSPCSRFAFLANDPGGIALHLATQADESDLDFSNTVLGVNQPYYYSWANTGHSMLWHVGADDVVEFAIDQGKRTQLTNSAGNFQAPAYSPIDMRAAYVAKINGRHHLLIKDQNGDYSTARTSRDGMYFQWSPDSNFIASAEGIYPLRDLAVTRADDLSTVLTKPIEEIISFFWSPNSMKIALVMLEDSAGPLPEANSSNLIFASRLMQNQSTTVLSWYLLDVGSGDLSKMAEFYPTQEEFYVLRYFDQYAQSHRMWSPDSRYIVYAHANQILDEPNGEIMLLDTTAIGEPPTVIMPGLQAIFSYQP